VTTPEKIILPGMTHWQHPRFFAYFPANSAPVSVIAEYLVTAMAAQCMLWQTSPAATELETKVLDWLRQAIGLPDGFSGVIQDSASSAKLSAVLVMRERALNWNGNKAGLAAGSQAASLGPIRYIPRLIVQFGRRVSVRRTLSAFRSVANTGAWTAKL
jgi:aromatic-L-amino-acid decarboxylase